MDIKEYIKESVRQVIKENAERQMIREIVKSELRKMYNEGVFEGDKKDDDESNKKNSEASDTAIGQLKNILDNNPMIKKSQIAYKLMPDVDPDSARHIFNDKLNGEDPMSTKEANIAIDAIHNAGV